MVLGKGREFRNEDFPYKTKCKAKCLNQTWAHAVENFRIYQYYLEGAENIQHNFSKISNTFYLSDSNFSKF